MGIYKEKGDNMKVWHIFLIFFILMVIIAYSSSTNMAHTYREKFLSGKHEIYVENSTTALVDNESFRVVHTGDLNVQSFYVSDILENSHYIILMHSAYGFIGQTQYVGFMKNARYYPVGSNITYMGLHINFITMTHNVFIYGYSGYVTGQPRLVASNFVCLAGFVAPYPLYESVYFNYHGVTYGMFLQSINGQTYVKVVTFIVNEFTIDSSILLIMMGVIIYAVGFVLMRRR